MLLTSPTKARRAVAAADAALPATPDATPDIHVSESMDKVVLGVHLTGVPGDGCTVGLMVWDQKTQRWYLVDGTQVALTAPGSLLVQADNPGGPVWPYVSVLSAGATVDTIVRFQRRKV